MAGKNSFQVRGLDLKAIDRLNAAVSGFGGVLPVAEATGLPASTIRTALRGEVDPRTSMVVAISRATGVSLDWLMFGGDERAGEPAVPKQLPQAQEATASVPFFDIRVSAGPGASATTETPSEHIRIDSSLLEKLGLKVSQLAMHTVSGDSAEPTMSDGDYVLVDRSATELRDGGMYVIGIDDDVLVKRVERMLDGTIKLSSDNPRYSPQVLATVDAERLRVIGRVRWVFHQF